MENVRIATAADKPAVIALLRLMAEESAVLPTDWSKVEAAVDQCFSEGVVLVAPAKGPVAGTMGLMFGQFWYSSDFILEDRWMFVHPEHRVSGHARRMLRAALETSRNLKIPLFAGVFSRHRLKAKTRLYSMILEPVGEIFLGN